MCVGGERGEGGCVHMHVVLECVLGCAHMHVCVDMDERLHALLQPQDTPPHVHMHGSIKQHTGGDLLQ